MSAPRLVALASEHHDGILALARGLAAWFQPLDQMALVIDTAHHEGVVALDGDEVVGFATYHVRGTREAELSWLAVAPRAQRQGVGGRMLAWVEYRLIERGVSRLEVSTVAPDYEPLFEPTNRFYRQRGFSLVRRDESHFAGGRPRLLYRKWLRVGGRR